ncbi:MAG: DUF5696 domain-containing protein [Oscillospiraceae bacterium]|nr:DUF5696 domain-containing protein [Oscillospiraceae bacterium]
MSIKIKKSAGCLLAGLLSLSLLVGCASSGKKDTNSAPKQEMAVSTQYSPLSSGEYGDLVARNDHFVLYFKPDTCSFQVRDNNTGVAWYSNPSDEELVPVQSEEVQNTYRSQVILQYYDDREKLTTLESFKDSVQKNQIEILSLKNGVRVVYTMGQIDSNVFPEVISESTMDELKAKMDEHAISRLERFYDRIVLDELTDSLKAEYLKTYPLLEKEPLYMVRKVHANIQEELSGYFKEAGLDKNWVYSEYDKIKYEYKVVEDVIFKVTADYTLTDDGLQASLYTSAIEYNASKFKLTSATLLPYFGSADDSDKGYMVLPDGSGGLVDLDRSSDQLITISVYGEDYSSMNYTEDFYGRQVLLPVYGMQCNGSGFIAVIESGAEVSQLMCQPGGTVYPRDAIYPSFTLLQRNALSTIEAGAYSRVVYAKEKYDRTLTIGYHLLPDNKQGYAGMANVLREQLFGNRKPSVSSNMPLYLQTVGAVQRQERFLSYKIEKTRALTTFDQTAELVNKLYERNIGNIQLIMDNWQGDAYAQKLSSSNTPSSVLGGQAALTKLQKTLQDGSQIYLHYNPLYRKKQSFGGLQSVLTINGKLWTYDGNLSSTNMILLNPASIVKAMDKVLHSAKKQSSSGIYLDMAGTVLYSDGNDSKFYNRTEMAELMSQQAERASEASSLMLSGGDWYVLKHADRLIDVPTSNSNLYVERESIPFIQMVLHGYISYTGGSLNMEDDYRSALLRTVEYGCELQYTLNYASPQLLKNTEYTSMFSTHYENWLDRVEQSWQKLLPVRRLLQGQRMISHFSPSDGVYVTGYENGVYTAVNYGENPVSYEGRTIPAKDFIWFEKGAGMA